MPFSANTAFATTNITNTTSSPSNTTTHTVNTTNTTNKTNTTVTKAAGSPTTTTPKVNFTSTQINSAASKVQTFVDTNHRLPNYVTINNYQVTMSQFLQLITQNTLNLNSEGTSTVTLKTVQTPPNTTDTVKTGTITKSGYLTLAQTITNYINTNGKAPSYVNSSLGKMNLQNMIYSFSKILSFQSTNQRLPNYVTVQPWTTTTSTTTTTTSSNVQSVIDTIGYAEAKFADVQGQSSPTVMAQVGYGDCWADSGWLFNQLTAKGIQTRIMECTDSSGLYYLHRWVDINTGNGWVVWNYAKYGSQHYGALGSGSFVESQGG